MWNVAPPTANKIYAAIFGVFTIISLFYALLESYFKNSFDYFLIAFFRTFGIIIIFFAMLILCKIQVENRKWAKYERTIKELGIKDDE